MADAKNTKKVWVKLNRALLINGEKHKVGDVIQIPEGDLKRFGKDVEKTDPPKKNGSTEG